MITKNNQPVTYTYRANGVRVHKLFVVNGQNIDTDYPDGFVYTTPYSPEIELALRETPESEEMSAAGQIESFELAEKMVIREPIGPVQQAQSKPNFFATAEGFYDYHNFRYIYQYKDHLGNTRLNFGRDENGDLFKDDSNDYYPFGLNFINPPGLLAQLFNPSATYKNYKYNGKELQETGMYDYGARFLMPDIGRWTTVDPLADMTRDLYGYAYNNPIFFNDPTGMFGEGPGNGDIDPNKPGGANNPILIQEVVITKVRPIKTQMADVSFGGMPSNCLPCQATSNLQINLPQRQFNPQPINFRPAYMNDGPIVYMGPSDIFAMLAQNFLGEKIGEDEASVVMTAASVALFAYGVKVQKSPNLWKVGNYNKLKGTELGLDAHHVGQSAIMKRMIEGYDPATAPSILVPKTGHTIGSGVVSRTTSGFSSPREVLARDIFELRRVYGPQGIPNSSLQELIQMNKTMYPQAFSK